MKILVCVKVVKGELNPFDESALECALRLSSDVTVVSMGPEYVTDALLPLTRIGAKVILVSDRAFAGSDTLATSYVLSQAIKHMEYDLILCGRQSIDGDTAQVGPMLSARLGLPLITNAMSLKIRENIICAETRMSCEQAYLPALVTVERGYILRFPSIFSKTGEISVWDNTKLKCDILRSGLNGSPTKVLDTFENERGRRKCKFISFDELLPLIEMKRNQNTVYESQSYNDDAKLKKVWVVGEEALNKAFEISKEVILIDKSEPDEIAKKILFEKPDVVLWNADFWGRKNAPVVAAMLETGLCADCTMLEADGENLIMYRPAQSGNIMAKIICVTKPQMATVRTRSESSDVIVSAGRGVFDKFEKIKEFAKKTDAQLCASRGLVDLNIASYDMQIGLTGKTVSPKIYIAVGISGAVHHTCAIECAETVIAINPDKDARIFEYADYGILEKFE